MFTIVNKKLLGTLQLIGGIGLIIGELVSIFGGFYSIRNIGNMAEFTTFIIVGLSFILMGIDNIKQT